MRCLVVLLAWALPTAALPAESLEWAVSDRRLLFQNRTVLRLSEIQAPTDFQLAFADDAFVFSGKLPESGKGRGASFILEHQFREPRRLFIPHLAPEPGFVIGDHSFRSPAIVIADRARALALIPDLDDVRRAYQDGFRVWLDYDHQKSLITVAAGDYQVAETHVLYRKHELDYTGQPVKVRLHVLASSRSEDVENPYGLAARFLWQKWGKAVYEEGGSQSTTVARYARYIEKWAFSKEGWGDTVWQEFSLGGRPIGAPVFIVDVAQHPSIPVEDRKWREQRSVWNQAWFSTQRVANGLYRYGRLENNEALKRRAALMTELALAAPQRDGLFPSVYTTALAGEKSGIRYITYRETPGWDKGRWSNSDRRPEGVSEKACHLLDAAFTARLLLEWADLVGGNRESQDYVARFADRLLTLQRPNGAFPGWVEPDGKVPVSLAEGPETAMGATLLLELAERFPKQERWRAAALKAIQYLEAGPVQESRWEDFETYYSCSEFGARDHLGRPFARNGVYKQNTLPIFWCAEAFLAAYRATKDPGYLNLGRRCLHELSLFQQVWNPPFIPANAHGGFGVMNGDGEWNDARQSLFAPLYLDYYRATGIDEYFERGVSALRASFAMLYCPENAQVKTQYELKHPFFGPESYGFMMENISHGGPAQADGSAIGEFTIFTWGNGAALASAAKIKDLYGDVYVDLGRKKAFGVDGCSAAWRENQVQVIARYGQEEIRVVFSDGKSRTLPLAQGRATLEMSPR